MVQNFTHELCMLKLRNACYVSLIHKVIIDTIKVNCLMVKKTCCFFNFDVYDKITLRIFF